MIRGILVIVMSALITVNTHAQLNSKAEPIYAAAKTILSSDYAKKQFPPKVAALETEVNLPDTITVDDNRLFNFGKSMRSKQGKVEAKHIPVILKIINSDSEISTAEKALLGAVKENKEITIYSTQASNKGYAVNLIFDTEPEAKQLLEDFYLNGVSINTLQHMHSHFIDSNNINNWLEYFYGNTQQKELAIAFMHLKFLDIILEANGDYKRYNRLFKNFIDGIKLNFGRRDESRYPEATRNIVLNMIKEFDEADYISLPDFVYMDAMKK